ncbi:MAG: putative MATE family efflux protein [Verrucomicrobiales bacterium]|jgi:putative MATE family efflux protein
MSIGFFFNTMYNVVDSFYAGRVSTSALAAMALSFPVFFIIIAMSEGIARGTSALVANAIGANDKSKEEALSGQVLSLGLLCAIGLTIVGLLSAEPLFRLLGATGSYLELATGYIHPLFWGAVFFLLSSMSNALLLAHGDSKTFGQVLVAGFFLNLLLDPWFLYGGFGLPAMGVPGIAIATVLIQALGGIYLFFTVVRRGYITMDCAKHFIPNFKIYGEILRQGIPTSFNMMSIALGFFVTTYYLKFYGEASVAAFGVGTRIEQIALLPAIGIGAAIVSIVGQNNGAGKIDRVRECVQLCVKYGFILITTASVLLFVFATPLVRMFTSDSEVIGIGTTYVRIVTFIQWAYVMSFIYIGFLQAVKRPMYGFIEAVIRKIILPLAVFYLLVRVLEVGLVGFWWGMVGINIAMAIVTILYAQSVMRKITATPSATSYK